MTDKYTGIPLLMATADWFDRGGLPGEATSERLVAARITLDKGTEMAASQNYREALRLFEAVADILKQTEFWGNGWGEVFLAQTICYCHLNKIRAAKQAWQKAKKLEPDDADIKEIGIRYKFISA